MSTIPTFIVVAFFVLFALVLVSISLGLRAMEAERKKKVTTALRTVRRMEERPETKILTEEDADRSGLGFSLKDLPLVNSLEQQLRQAGLDWSPAAVLAASAVGVIAALLLGLQIAVPVFREAAMVLFALLLGALPILYVRFKRNKRIGAFEEQFPDTLDFLARSLRAGHAFSVCLEMIAEESPEPVAGEFRVLYHEQNLGAPLEEAMKDLAKRVPLLDVRFFVSAVLLQREIGGNLAEILDKLAYVIRERFRIKGHVRAVSAHGRITATVLTVMPLVTMLALMVVAPRYLGYLATNPTGKYLIVATIVAMLVGYYWMRRIIDIKV